MNLGELFEFAVGRGSNMLAFVDEEGSYTYRELNHEANRVASSLKKLGIRHRDRVMVLMKNRLQTVCLFWALQKLGAIFTPINFHRSPSDIAYCINDVEPKAIIYEDFVHPFIPKVNLETKPIYISLESDGGDISYSELLKNGSDSFTCHVGNDDDIALMLYTSGTSGVPKGVPRSHRNEYASTMAHIIQNRYKPFDSTIGVMPLYHTMGVRSLLAMTILNGKFAAVPDFDSETILSIIANERISSLYMIPMRYHELLKNKHFGDFNVSSIRTIGYAGASMSPTLIQECDRAFRPGVFLNHYGSTEIYTFSTCTNLKVKPGCAGKPGINQNIRLVSLEKDADIHSAVGKNEMGQIVAHMGSDEAFKGYWNRPEVTREVIREGWYYTGDIGIYDDEDDLFVVGRVDEMVISGADHIFPFKVEQVLSGHPSVTEVAVVGEKDERWGQIVAAYVVSKDSNLSPLDLERFCKQNSRLSSYERPRRYVFVNELPKGPTGKLLRRQLICKGEESK